MERIDLFGYMDSISTVNGTKFTILREIKIGFWIRNGKG